MIIPRQLVRLVLFQQAEEGKESYGKDPHISINFFVSLLTSHPVLCRAISRIRNTVHWLTRMHSNGNQFVLEWYHSLLQSRTVTEQNGSVLTSLKMVLRC